MYFIGNSIIKNDSIAPLSEQRITGIDNEVYELFRVEEGHPIFLSDHIQRFSNSLKTANRQIPEDFDKLKLLIDWLILCNGIKNSDVRLCLSPDGLFQGGFVPSVYPTKQMYKNGVNCSILNAIREHPTAKIYHAEMRTEAAEQQKCDDVYESILVDVDGLVTEGSRSNIFFVKDEKLFTAPTGKVLGGIMRKKIAEICQKERIEIDYVDIPLTTIEQFEAAFISSTPARILPIKSIAKLQYDVNNALIHRLIESMEEEVKKQI